MGELDAIEISETVANVLKKGFSSLHEQLSVPHALFLISSCAFLCHPPNVEPEKTNFWSNLSQQRKFKRTCVSYYYYLSSLKLFPNGPNYSEAVKSRVRKLRLRVSSVGLTYEDCSYLGAPIWRRRRTMISNQLGTIRQPANCETSPGVRKWWSHQDSALLDQSILKIN